MRKDGRRGSLVVAYLTLFLFSSTGHADIFDSSRQARISCENFSLEDIFDVSSFLDFSIEIGDCSLGTTGLTDCQEKAIDFKTATDKLLGNDFKMFNPELGCVGKTQSNDDSFGSTLSISSSGIDMPENEIMGNWAQERYDNAEETDSIGLFSRTAMYIDPKDGSLLFSGGATSSETRGIITRDANMAGVFTDGADETMIADNSASKNIEKCKEAKASDSLACSLSENLKLYTKMSDKRGELIDANSKRNSSLIEVAALTSTTIVFPTKELSEQLPIEDQVLFAEGGMLKINTDALFRARIEAINNHRKSMSKLLATKSALSATSKYPEVSKEEAKKITAGNLP